MKLRAGRLTDITDVVELWMIGLGAAMRDLGQVVKASRRLGYRPSGRSRLSGRR
jgi:hypothetical protein